jgi:hypothetical protein
MIVEVTLLYFSRNIINPVQLGTQLEAHRVLLGALFEAFRILGTLTSSNGDKR